MRKKAAKGSSTGGKKPKHKDASTQTYRYVDYIPLPILVDIKSENESDDAASYTEPFNDDMSEYNDPIIETLKIEMPHLKQSVENNQPPIEELLFEEKIILPEPRNAKPTKKPKSKSLKPLDPSEKVTKKRKEPQTTRKSSDGEPKKKRIKKNHGNADAGGSGVARKSVGKADFVECSLCSFKCQRPSHLKRHLLMHTGERPHRCEHCPKSFAQKTDLNRHMTIHAALFNYHCESCGRGFSDDDTLKKHEQRCNTKRYTCDICNYMTFSIGNMDLHKRKHTGERPYACTSCDKRFTRVAHLNQHVKLHANDFEMHCNMCGRGFSEEEELFQHEISCKNRMFQCHMCRDTHIRMDNLRRHIKITHMGEKEVLCEYCSKQFPTKSSLSKHIKFKHPERMLV